MVLQRLSIVLLFCLISVLQICCQQSTQLNPETGITGQVYEIGSPAIQPGWTPPPLKTVSTIILQDSSRIELMEFNTDSLGSFSISLKPDTYFLVVKDSMRSQRENGLFIVVPDKVTFAKVYHDNGMR